MEITPEKKKQLIQYLSNFVTDERFQKFTNNLKNRTRSITVVIEDIYQTHNTSAVLRTCDCLGIQDIHVIEMANNYEVNDEIALGASKWLDIYKYSDNEDSIKVCYNKLKEKGYKILATTPHQNDCLITELNLEQPIALVFGTEKDGLSANAIQHADAFVKIPMYGFTESYNISVSAAICLFHLSEKLRQSSIAWRLSELEQDDIMLQWLKNSIRESEKIIQQFVQKFY